MAEFTEINYRRKDARRQIKISQTVEKYIKESYST